MRRGSLRVRCFGNQPSGKKLVFNIESLLGFKYVCITKMGQRLVGEGVIKHFTVYA